jgi:outer membrane protein OmpA-like peptidoglycan-associated protein
MRKHPISMISAIALFCLAPGFVLAQGAQAPDTTGKTIQAIGYVLGQGTTIDLKNSGLIAQASGEAKVEAKKGTTNVEASVENMKPPVELGSEFLTYVLWAVSPEGRAINLGGIVLENGKGKLKATTQLQSFSLFVTAEPYSAVRVPSEMLVLENALRKGTKGKVFPVNNYQLMRRSQYQKLGNPLALSLDLKNVPLEMYEARNAVDIARSRGADKYAPDIFSKAEGGLKLAENALARKADKKEIIATARQAAQSAEDARIVTVRKQEEERIENERLAAAAKAKSEAEAKAAAEAAEAKRRTDEEARRQAELTAAKEAQLKAEAAARQAQLKAESDAKEAQMKAEAEIAASKAKAEADALKAREEAAKMDADRARLAAEQLRAKLLDQFNRVLETRESPRGLVITMADVLFDTGKYDLKSTTRETLARLAGIVLANQGLNLAVEGHTDSTGSDVNNQKLSEQRATTVRDFLVKQGLDMSSVSAAGFGETMPVADNGNAAGRQKNRRVELVVSGEVIGVKIGSK